ncbi:lipopolysaccharide kinase InaA family protein [uncultured Alistipes sp.]|jgi:Lipopolysaccharide kinase (Kdo/WaaP) family protein|uniref:lipopolysaccharide kinase InaA family protein n=1 Tax=uncultured Alistipes sp. TaxID=538949 RepID=UPI0025EB1803|nr:lipopolysaccharide kinase InaA family protein [uncultured Alistipes sp.]
MKITINPAMRHLGHFVEQLPELFPVSGEVLHDGRNQIRVFDIGGERFVVKRYKRPNLLNTIAYSFFRKSKARRAYEHALHLRELDIDTPEPVSWSEYRKNGIIRDTYFVSRWSAYTSLGVATKDFPSPDSLSLLTAFARFTARLHQKGICHEDFNQTNTLWQKDQTNGSYRFQLIDINRMKFQDQPLSPRDCMVNLRRLGCSAGAFFYILDRYADTRGWDLDDTLLRGTFYRLLFGHRQQVKKRFRKRKMALAGKKQG